MSGYAFHPDAFADPLIRTPLECPSNVDSKRDAGVLGTAAGILFYSTVRVLP
jgi:hypothetical protein